MNLESSGSPEATAGSPGTTLNLEGSGSPEGSSGSPVAGGILESFRYRRGSLWILNQLLLPQRVRYQEVEGVERAWTAIRNMEVRGAPAIALVGCLSLAVELARGAGGSGGDPGGDPPGGDPKEEVAALVAFVEQRLGHLVTARPTAVNMAREGQRLRGLLRGWAQEPNVTPGGLRERIIEHVEGLLEKDVGDNERIGAHGADAILSRVPPGPVTLLTHCNTGALATAGYGTALGIVRALHSRGRLSRVLFTESRPHLQGSRLTAPELRALGIPGTLIPDSAAATALRDLGVQAVVVGADRVAANGDTANKIGTFQVAVAAGYLGVPFFVAAPSSSCDLSLARGSQIPIEQRPAHELTQLGGLCLAPPDTDVWNPAFDVTPHELITGGIVTEFGVFAPGELRGALEERGAGGGPGEGAGGGTSASSSP